MTSSERKEAWKLLTQYLKVEARIIENDQYANYDTTIRNAFMAENPDWGVDLFSSQTDDNAFLYFRHHSWAQTFIFYIYTNDDPLYILVDSVAKPRYHHELLPTDPMLSPSA